MNTNFYQTESQRIKRENDLDKAKAEDAHQRINSREQALHYRHYYQFNSQITPHLLILLANKPLALKILAVILFCSWRKRCGAVAIEQKYLCKAVAKRPGHKANRSSVEKAIHYLRALGVIAISRYNGISAFIINPDFIWQLPPSKPSLKNKVINNNPEHIRHIRFDADPIDVRKLDQLRDQLETAYDASHPLSFSDFKFLKSKPSNWEAIETERNQKGIPVKNAKGMPKKIKVKKTFMSYYQEVFQRDYQSKKKLKHKKNHEYYIKHRK